MSAGFLCWQTDNGRQNDAVMYGAMLKATFKPFTLRADVGGYSGWEYCGDQPLTLKLRADILTRGALTPFLSWQKGLQDWPFDHFRAGVKVVVR